MTTLTIPAVYNGPPGSANGGVTCGLLAQATGLDEVTLRQPPPLGETPELLAIDTALRPAFVKDPAQRLPRVEALAASLREAAAPPITRPTELSRSGALPTATRVTRFAALPLRVLRADAETDFLAFSVPDAVSSSLASLDSVIVRTPRSTSGSETDLRVVGRGGPGPRGREPGRRRGLS